MNVYKSLKVKLIQLDLIWHNAQLNLDEVEKQINLEDKGKIIVLPEMFTTGFTMKAEDVAEDMNGYSVTRLKKMAKQNSCIITGSIVINENDKFYNRMLWILPNGGLNYYDKRHLFSLAGEDLVYSSGHDRVIVSVNGWKILVLICYDLRFPVWSRNDLDFDAIIIVANWPEKRDYAWKHLLISRAIENQCFVIASNRVGEDDNGINYLGRSCVINPMGELVEEIVNKPGIIDATLNKELVIEIRQALPFLKDRDIFNIL